MSELKQTDQKADVKYDTNDYDDDYMEWISENYKMPIEQLKQMTNEELSAFLKKAFALEQEQKRLREKHAFQAVNRVNPRFSFDEILGGVTVNDYPMDDGYWNLFCAVMDLLPEDSRSNKGRTISEFMADSLAVAELYDQMYEWVDQDLEEFGLIGNLHVSLKPSYNHRTSTYRFESFDFEKALEDFEAAYCVL